MSSFLKKIRSSQLFKITSLNSISVLIKIGIGLITSKALAIFIGPSGMALVGNLRNFLTSVESISTLGFQNGIVKYVAESENDSAELKKIFSTLFFSLIVIAFLLSGVLFCFSDYWNGRVFGHDFQYGSIFKALAIALPWYAASIFLLAIMNGFGKFKKVIYINIIGTLIGFVVTLVLIWKYLILGALLAIIIAPSLLFFVSFYFVAKEMVIIGSIKWAFFDFKIIKNLSHYFLMAVVSGVLGPLVFLAIRNEVIDSIGITAAGFWEAISRVSTYYLLFVNTLLTVYYYPKLVVAKNNQETKLVIWSFYKNVLPLFGLGLIAVYFFRILVVKILFTNDFEPVSDLFLWQMVGDFFKVVSWILGLQFFAKKMTKGFIITEVLSLVILFLSSFYFISIFKIEGVVIAHALTYFVYTLVLGTYFRKSLF